MPQTRSQIRTTRPIVHLSDSDTEETKGDVKPEDMHHNPPSDDDSTEEHVIHVQSGVLRMKRELKALRKKNESLEAEISAAKKAQSERSPQRLRRDSESDDDTNLMNIQLRDLVKTVKSLKSENLGYRNQIDKLKSKQLKDELKDLQLNHESDGEVEDCQAIDTESRMRKLLRKFSDLMLVITISDDKSEQCSICFEVLQLKKCSALECLHIVCHECLPQISRGADETVKCPECRKPSPREALELVHMTEQGRWDALLEVAQAWDAFDNRGAMETSEEEDEEGFVIDSKRASECSSETGHSTNHAEDTASDGVPAAADDVDSTAPAAPPRKSFLESPRKEKRKILEGLVDERARKRRK